MALKIFCSYSHNDENAIDQLRNHLSGLRRQGLIEDWHDRKIPPGGDWDKTIKQNLEAAHLILLLVSSDFIKSDYCMGLETARAVEREQEGTATVLPIFLRECHIEGLSFTYLQGVPKDRGWIDQQVNQDKAWTEVVGKIREVAALTINGAFTRRDAKDFTVSSDTASPPEGKEGERSSKLFMLILCAASLTGILAWYFWPPPPPDVGERLLRQGKYKDAQDSCTEDPESPARTRCLYIANLMLEPRTPEQFSATANELYDTAENDLEKAYALTAMGEAIAARAAGYAKGNEYYRQAIDLDPEIAQAYFGIGQIRYKQKRFQEAVYWYKEAVERAPDNRRYLHNLAATFAANNQPQLAEEKYRALLDMGDSQMLAYAELMEVLKSQGKIEDARELAAQAKQRLTDSPDWKNEPLNAEDWLQWYNDEPRYLKNWEEKRQWLDRVFTVE